MNIRKENYIIGILGLVLLLLWFMQLDAHNHKTNPPWYERGGEGELHNYVVDPGDVLEPESLLKAIPLASLTRAEVEDLRYLREEEKLAYDLYVTLHSVWEEPIFTTIAQSEFSHMIAIEALLDRYGLRDTAIGTVGFFMNQELQTLYDTWVVEGSASRSAALMVGARVEEANIYTVQEALARTDNTDIVTVYENLLRGSRNHLRAFNYQIVNQTGEQYIPEYLSADELETILSESVERGPRGGWPLGDV